MYLHCKKVLKITGGSTKGLHNHLKTHGILDQISDEGSQKKIAKIASYYECNKMKLHFQIPRLASLDGMSLNAIAKSHDLHLLIKDLPLSPTSIQVSIIYIADFIRSNITNAIMELKTRGRKFSIAVDEWTSISHRRYLNLNIHTYPHQVFHTGLVRVKESFTAHYGLELITNHLSLFGMSMQRDVVAIVCDGASVMVKLFRISQVESQFVYSSWNPFGCNGCNGCNGCPLSKNISTDSNQRYKYNRYRYRR